MKGPDRNLRGEARTSPDALVLCDLLSTFDFPRAGRIIQRLEGLAPTLLALRARADKAGVPVVYVNDNVGAWRSERSVVLSALDEPRSKFPEALRGLCRAKRTSFCSSQSTRPFSARRWRACCGTSKQNA